MKVALSSQLRQSSQLPTLEERWNDRALSSTERFTAYLDFIRHLGGELSQVLRRESRPHARQHLAHDLGFEAVWQEYERITSHTYSEHTFVQEQDSKIFATILGERFLGVEAWRTACNADIGIVPAVPHIVTADLLNSPSPLHPGRLVKETHFLTLIPSHLNGNSMSLVELITACGREPETQESILFEESVALDDLRQSAVGHVSVPQSRWALVAESDPEASEVPPERLLRGKGTLEQERVLHTFYPEYQLAHPVDFMTGVLLHRVVNGKRMFHDLIQRCEAVERANGKSCWIGPYHGRLLLFPEKGAEESFLLLGAALTRRI